MVEILEIPQDNTRIQTRDLVEYQIPDDIKLQAAMKGMTVEEYLQYEASLQARKEQGSGVIVDGSNPQPFIAKVSRNPQEQARIAAGKKKATEEALKTVNGVLEATLPSTWINFSLKANGKEEMSDAASLAVDFAPAILGLGFSAAKRVAPRVFASKTSRVSRPIFEGVPIEEGYMYHTTDGFKPHPIYPYRKGVDGKIRHYGEWTKGSLRKEDGKYVSVRPKHGDTDYIWWDTKGHNGGKEVYVTKLNDNATNVLQNLEQLDISQYAGKYEPTYYVTEPIDISKTIKFTRDPIFWSYIPSVPGKVVTNKMTIPELFSVAPLKPQHNPKTSLAFFERPSNISEAERLGIPKGKRKKNIHTGRGTELPDPAYSEINYPGEYDPITNPKGTRTPYQEWADQAIKRAGRNRTQLMLHRASDHDEVIGNLKKYAKQYDGEIYSFVKNKGDNYYTPEIIGDYRSYLNHLGYDGAKLTDDEIAKILSAQYFQLSSIMSGKGKGKILWHSSPEWFDRFEYETNLAKNTKNVGYAGAGNNFSTNRTLYGGKDVNNTQPFMINNINSIPSSTTGRQRGFVPDYGYSDYIEQALLDTPHDYKLIWNTSGFNPQGTLKSDLLGEFTFRRNDGIKSLFPHPSLISVGDDGIVKIDRDLSNILFNYRKGGKLNYINLYKN